MQQTMRYRLPPVLFVLNIYPATCKNTGLAARNIFNSAICFAPTEEKLQTGMYELQGVSPQEVDYLRGTDLV